MSQQPYRATQHSCSDIGLHTGQEKSSADRCGPPSVRPPVLVILLVERGGYLFLHQPQLIAQVVVGFHEVLDLGLRGRERVFHLHVFMHSDGAVGEVRVQALWEREGLNTERISGFYL